MIIHGEDTYNYGNFMMLINFINYLAKEMNYNCEFIVRLNSKKDLYRLAKALNNKKIVVKMFQKKEVKFQGEEDKKIKYLFKKILVLKCRLIDDLNQIKRLIKEFKINEVFVLGGENLSEYYKGWVISTNLLQIKVISSIAKVFLISKTIGPFYLWRKKFANYCLKNTHIYCRDIGSVNYLNNNLGLRDNIF